MKDTVRWGMLWWSWYVWSRGDGANLAKKFNTFIHSRNIGRWHLVQNTRLVEKGAFATRLQCLTAFKIQNGCQGASKWLTGSTKGSKPKFLGASVNFCYISILIQVAVLREKVVTENGMENNKLGLSWAKLKLI